MSSQITKCFKNSKNTLPPKNVFVYYMIVHFFLGLVDLKNLFIKSFYPFRCIFLLIDSNSFTKSTKDKIKWNYYYTYCTYFFFIRKIGCMKKRRRKNPIMDISLKKNTDRKKVIEKIQIFLFY